MTLNKPLARELGDSYVTNPNAAHVVIAQTANLILAANFPIAIAIRVNTSKT